MNAKLFFSFIALIAATLVAIVSASNPYGPTYNEGYEQPAYGHQQPSYNPAPTHYAPAYKAPSWAKHSQYDNYYPKYQKYNQGYSAPKPSYGYQAPAAPSYNSYESESYAARA